MLAGPAARKIFDLLQQAEMAHLLKGTPHVEYLLPYRNRAQGQLKKELSKICALGDQAKVFIDYFLKEFGA